MIEAPATQHICQERCRRCGYTDPVYYKTQRFTAKSDVYSFGVVLLELITGKVAMFGEKILTMDFEKSYKEHGNGREIYDAEILSHDHASSHSYMECLDMVGVLVVQCLNGDADERPTMAQVVEELNKVKSMACRGPCSEATCKHAPMLDGNKERKKE